MLHCVAKSVRPSLPFAVFLLLALGARAQCLDWVPGFGTTGFGANYPVRALTVFDDGTGSALYAGGDFNQIGGVSTAVGRWNGAGWTAVGPAFESGIEALATYDDGTGPALYMGGYFSTVNGAPANALARWNGSAWTSVGGGIIGNVHSMVVFDDGHGPALYVAGAFSNVGGSTPASRIARWDGSTWAALSSGLNGEADALAVHDDGSGLALYVAGYFTTAGGTNAIHVARWNGSTWSALGSGLAGSSTGVLALLSYNGALYAGGTFQVSGSTNVRNIAKWNGSSWSPLGSGTDDTVQSLSHFDDGTGDALYAGGAFTTAGSQPANRIAKWNGSTWSPLSVGATSATSGTTVFAIQKFDDGNGPKLYAAGQFDHAGGNPSTNIGCWGIPCYAPVITIQPSEQTAVFAQNVVFHVEAIGTAPVTYQWRKNESNLTDTAQTTGSLTDTLTLHYYAFGDAGSYDCVISNNLGTVISNEALLIVPAGGNTGQPIQVTTIMAPPQPAPDSPGDTYTTAGTPLSASTGEIVFSGKLNEVNGHGGTPVVTLWQNRTPAILYRAGDPAPGTPPGTTFVGCTPRRALANGGLLFIGQIQGAGIDATNNTGVWYRDGSGTDLVVQLGSQPDGASAGMTLKVLDNLVVGGDGGDVAFRGAVYNGSTFAWLGIWHWRRDSGQSLLARSGATAPGTADNFTALGEPQIDATGSIAFAGTTTTSGGLWVGQPGGLQLIAQVGAAAPGLASGTTFTEFEDAMVFGASGDLALQARVIDTNNVQQTIVYRLSQGTLNLILAGGMPAPGADPTGVFSLPAPGGINQHAVLVRSGVLTGCQSQCLTSGFWLADPTAAPTLIAGNNFAFPEIPATWVFQQFETATLNANDQVVFQAEFEYGETFHGVFGWTPLAGVFPIAIPGTQFQVAPGDVRTVSAAYLTGVNGSITGPYVSANLDDNGRVALEVQFSNISRGVFSGEFVDFLSLYFAPGIAICPGDGTAGACPCGNSGLAGHGCNNSASNGGAVLTSSGGASLADDNVILTAQGELPNALSIFLQGKQLIAGVPFGDGLRCINGSLKRIAVKNAHSGSVTYPVAGNPSISQRSAQLGDPITSSTKRYYQTYYRDPVLSFCPAPTGNSWNVSNGQQVLWYP